MLTWLEKSNKGREEMETDVQDIERARESENVCSNINRRGRKFEKTVKCLNQ